MFMEPAPLPQIDRVIPTPPLPNDDFAPLSPGAPDPLAPILGAGMLVGLESLMAFPPPSSRDADDDAVARLRRPSRWLGRLSTLERRLLLAFALTFLFVVWLYGALSPNLRNWRQPMVHASMASLVVLGVIWIAVPLRCGSDRAVLERHPMIPELLSSPVTSFEIAHALHDGVLRRLRVFAGALWISVILLVATIVMVANQHPINSPTPTPLSLWLICVALPMGMIAGVYHRATTLVATSVASRITGWFNFTQMSMIEVGGLFIRFNLWLYLGQEQHWSAGTVFWAIVLSEVIVTLRRMRLAWRLWREMAGNIADELAEATAQREVEHAAA